jgi:hypothetical protein
MAVEVISPIRVSLAMIQIAEGVPRKLMALVLHVLLDFIC